MRDKYTDKRKLDRQIRKLTKIVDSKFTNKNFLKKKTRRIVNEHMRNDGNKPVIEIPEQLDLMGRLLVKTHENIERQNISRRTRTASNDFERVTHSGNWKNKIVTAIRNHF